MLDGTVWYVKRCAFKRRFQKYVTLININFQNSIKNGWPDKLYCPKDSKKVNIFEIGSLEVYDRGGGVAHGLHCIASLHVFFYFSISAFSRFSSLLWINALYNMNARPVHLSGDWLIKKSDNRCKQILRNLCLIFHG